MTKTTGRIIIMGASSGIGYELASRYLEAGWRVGMAARHTDSLSELSRRHPGLATYAAIDVTAEDAPMRLRQLITDCGGMDIYLHVSGIGWQNMTLDAEKELSTAETNAVGFVRCVGEAYRYFAENGRGHLAAVTSIAGTKGLGAAPAYSASKAFATTYLQALEQQARIRRLNIHFTDLRPGFVCTNLLGDGKHYPMLMDTKSVAKAIMRAIRHRRHVAVIDWRYRILTTLWRWIPNCVWRRMRIKN